MEKSLEETVEGLLHEIDGIKTDGENVYGENFEVGGVKVVEITDKKGRVWSVPADDNNVDMNEGGLRNILNIPNPEKDFYYQYVGADRLSDFLSRDFALVEPEEVGLPKALSDAASAAIGVRPTSHHQVGNLHLVKIPKLLEARYRKASKMRADEAVAGIKTPRHLGKAIEDTDVKIHSRKTEEVKGKPIVTPNPGFKEYPENQ
jgi:hypothetical protein